MMKTINTALTISLLLGATSLAFSNNAVKINYSGDRTAKAVCVSIVHDQVNKLKRSLRNAKSHPLDRPHTFFRCNDMELDHFADAMDSPRTSDYLNEKFDRREIVTTEEIAAAR